METVSQSDTMHLKKEGKRARMTFTRESHLNAVNNEGGPYRSSAWPLPFAKTRTSGWWLFEDEGGRIGKSANQTGNKGL
jgi:hypothetical protein